MLGISLNNSNKPNRKMTYIANFGLSFPSIVAILQIFRPSVLSEDNKYFNFQFSIQRIDLESNS